jgi:hypothetical protein
MTHGFPPLTLFVKGIIIFHTQNANEYPDS